MGLTLTLYNKKEKKKENQKNFFILWLNSETQPHLY